MDTLKEILVELKKPFPSADHKERKLPGGGKWFFIPWQRIRERLDEVYPGWSASYSDPVLCEGVVVVRCRLTIGNVTREGVGNSETDKGYGTPVERATADAFKNAAEAFGVGAYLDDQMFVIKHLQSKGDGRGVKFGMLDKKAAVVPKPAPQSQSADGQPTNQNVRIRTIRELLNFGQDRVVQLLHPLGAGTPNDLNPIQCDQLVSQMCVEWASKFMNVTHAQNSFGKHAIQLKQQGHSEIEAIQSWMKHVQSQPAQGN